MIAWALWHMVVGSVSKGKMCMSRSDLAASEQYRPKIKVQLQIYLTLFTTIKRRCDNLRMSAGFICTREGNESSDKEEYEQKCMGLFIAQKKASNIQKL